MPPMAFLYPSADRSILPAPSHPAPLNGELGQAVHADPGLDSHKFLNGANLGTTHPG